MKKKLDDRISKKLEEGIKKLVAEKAVSKSQRALFGLAKSVKSGETPRSEVSQDVLDIEDDVSTKEIDKFAGTKEKGLPEKVKKKKVKEGELEEAEIPILDLDQISLEEEYYGGDTTNKFYGGKPTSFPSGEQWIGENEEQDLLSQI